MFLKFISVAFLLFAITRVWLRYRDGSIGMVGAFGWGMLWLVISGVVWLPNLTNTLAHLVGVGRGADAIIYASIITLFYAVFRLYVKAEYLSHEITHLVRALSMKDRE